MNYYRLNVFIVIIYKVILFMQHRILTHRVDMDTSYVK